MTTDLIEKLKDNIDIDLASKFDYLDFVKYSFIPMCLRNNNYYIATDDKKFTLESEQFIKGILGQEKNYKFIALSSNILNDLITWYQHNVYHISEKARKFLNKSKKSGANQPKKM